MLNGYIQIKEAANRWEIGERRINELCLNGRIKGAVKFGNTWAILGDSEKPADARIKSGKYIKGEEINNDNIHNQISCEWFIN